MNRPGQRGRGRASTWALVLAGALGLSCGQASSASTQTDPGAAGAGAGGATAGGASANNGVPGATSGAPGATSGGGQAGVPATEAPSLSWNECLAYRGDSKFLTCKTSGGAVTDDTFRDAEVYRHDQLCGGTWRSDGVLRLRLYVWARANYEMVWSLDVAGLAPGELGSSRSLELEVEQYAGHRWVARDVCALDVTSNEVLGAPGAYALTASLSCSEPIADQNGGSPLLVERFAFSVAIDARP